MARRNAGKPPSWFSKRRYAVALSCEQWLREVRWRVEAAAMLEWNGKRRPLPSLLSHYLEFVATHEPEAGSDHRRRRAVAPLTVGEVAYLHHKTRAAQDRPALRRWTQLLDDVERINERAAIHPLGPELFIRNGVTVDPELLRKTIEEYDYEKTVSRYLRDRGTDEKAALDQSTEHFPPVLEWLLGPYEPPIRGAAVTIDMQFDDETIVRDLKNYLRTARGWDKPVSPISAAHFRRWERYKVREAFDLQTWSAATNTPLTDSDLADILWPGQLDPYPLDVLRRTTRPLVKRVFTPAMEARLSRQALRS